VGMLEKVLVSVDSVAVKMRMAPVF
jgi:hypothetical protein